MAYQSEISLKRVDETINFKWLWTGIWKHYCINTYKNRETIDKYSYVASLEDIKNNDYNLNIPRYVDTFEEEPIDLNLVHKDLKRVDKDILEIETVFNNYLKELGVLKDE